MTEPRPQDPADRAIDAKADGAFGGGLTNHRAGYGDDKLARLIDWVRQRPTATLASGEGALLLAEIDRLRARCRQIDDEAYDYAEQIEQLKAAAKDSADHYADARAEIDRLRDDLQKQADWADWAKGEIDRLRDDLHTQDGWVQWAKGEMDRMHAAAKDSMDHYTDARAEVDRLRDQLYLADQSARSSSAEAARLGRILAALREPSESMRQKVLEAYFSSWDSRDIWTVVIRAAVAAAEQEVGRE